MADGSLRIPATLPPYRVSNPYTPATPEPVMTRYLTAALLAVFVLPVGLLHVQDSNDEWLANCREGWGDWGQRARHCEIRETGMKVSEIGRASCRERV